MIRYNVKAFTRQQLDQDAQPELYGQPEFIPWGYYDSQDFVTSFGSVSFFASTNSDPTITNMTQAGAMPADQYFRPFCFTLDWLIGATSITSSGAVPIVDDLLGIQNTARSIFYFSISNKLYCQVGLHALHSSGGIYVSYQTGNPTGSGLGNYGMNWFPDGGYWVNGAFVLSPRNSFTCAITPAAASVALSSTRKGRVTMWGPLGRRVL